VALTPLATAADLAARGIISVFPQVDVFLAEASAAVREAAGSPISQTTSTVKLHVHPGTSWIRLPGQPVTAVTAVELDGEPLTDGWSLVDGELHRPAGWASAGPTPVTVTYTHGLPVVPEDIVGLACSIVAAAKAALDEDDEGLGLAVDNGRVQSVTIDNFTETYSTAGEAVAAVTPFMLPERTRRWLATRFGGGAAMVASR
jgi:hypothetical protein